MPDEQMDDMIRDAANLHLPPYNDAAWDKMEKLLDKHLPQKKNKRRFFYFFLLFLAAGGGVFYSIHVFTKGNTPIASIATNNKENIPATNNTIVTGHPMTMTGTKITNKSNSIDLSDISKTTGSLANNLSNLPKSTSETKTENITERLKSVWNRKAISSMSISSANLFSNEENAKQTNLSKKKERIFEITGNYNAEPGKVIDKDPDNTGKTPVNPMTLANKFEDQSLRKETNKVVNDKVELKDQAKNTLDKKQSVTSKNTKKSKPYIPGNFGLTFSIGPDISFVANNKPGNLTLTYGVGLNYTFFKRLILQSGFYVSKKIYSADSANYHPAPAFWSYYPNMQNIDANCKVYEIPVELSYSFGEKGKHSWFAGTGLSSYLMKTETYTYDFKNSTGQNLYRTNTYSNKNNHYFSVLDITGGYRYNINKHISLSASPYLKIPLSGIGFGKVKLNSTGLIFTATVKPFAKRK